MDQAGGLPLRYEEDRSDPSRPAEPRRAPPRGTAPDAPTHDRDLDFDPPAAGATMARRRPTPSEYQRLVANPFLAVFWLIVLVRASHARPWPSRSLLASSGSPLAACSALGYLLQYHCLDCGPTGLLFRWRSHACPTRLARQQTGRARRSAARTRTRRWSSGSTS